MEYDGKWHALGSFESGQLFSNSDLISERHELGHAAPGVIAHMVDVAIAAIEVAAAGDFQQDRIYVHNASLAIVAVEGAVVAARNLDLFRTNLLNKPADRRAVDRGVQRLGLVHARL